MRKLKLLALVLCLLVPGLLLAADTMWQGADNTPNNKQGNVGYEFGHCYDGTAWDMVRCVAGVLSMAITSPLGSQAEATSVATAPPTDAYYMVSRDTLANAVDNPIAVQLSQDGTNAVDATHPIPISADLAANATGNRIWVTSDMDMVASTATNVNGGNRDAGTQTVTLADDDPAVASLGIMDDWDATHDSAVVADGPQIMGEAHSAQPAAVADGDAARPALTVYGYSITAGYVWATNANRTQEVDPISSHHSEVTLCSLTNVAANTSGTCGYWDMDGYSTFSVHCIADTAPTDTMTYNVECSGEDNGTAPASCTYIDITTSLNEMNDNDHNGSYVDEETILIPEFAVPFKYCKVDYVTSDTGGGDADLECFVKKMY